MNSNVNFIMGWHGMGNSQCASRFVFGCMMCDQCILNCKENVLGKYYGGGMFRVSQNVIYVMKAKNWCIDCSAIGVWRCDQAIS